MAFRVINRFASAALAASLLAPALASVVVATALGGCVTSKQYTLTLDPSDPKRNTLCERTNKDKPDAPPECHPVTGATLTGPSTLAVELDNADPSRTYIAHVEQTTQTAAGQIPQAVIAEVIGRFGDMVKTVEGKDPATPVVTSTLLSGDAAATLDKGLRAVGLDSAAGTIATLRDATVAAPETVFFDATWVTPAVPATNAPAHFATLKDVMARDPNKDRPLFGVGWSDLPPARDRVFTAEIVPRLVTAGFAQATVEDDVVKHVLDVCSDFGVEPYDGKATAWAPYLEGLKLESLQGTEVLRDIGVDVSKLVELLRGKDTSVLGLLRSARTSAKAAYESGARPAAAQQVIHLLYATARLYDDAQVCAANLDFAAALTKDKAVKTKLETARASAARVLTSARVGRDLFRAFIDPMVTRSVVEALTAGGSTHVAFGTVTLRPGKVNVAVADNATPAKQVASYEFRVSSPGTISISVGPMLVACDGCFETVTEEVTPGDGMTMAARTLRRDRRGFGSGVATLLQFPLISYKWFELGPCIGYPISDVTGASKAILAGVSLGHRSGVSLSAGIHMFGTRRLKGGYGEVIDTSQPGLEALTAESVSTPTYSASFFLSLNISTSLLARAGGAE